MTKKTKETKTDAPKMEKKKKNKRNRRENSDNFFAKSPKIQKIKSELENITNVNQLKAIRDSHNVKTGEYINKLKKMQNEIVELSNKSDDYKKKRDELNENVSALKVKKDAIINNLKSVSGDLYKIKEQEKKKDTSSMNVNKQIRGLQKKIEALEKKVITDDLTLNEENKIVESIGDLEKEFQKLYENKPDNQFKDYYEKIGVYKTELNGIKDQILQFAEESQNWHLLYIDLKKEIYDVQREKSVIQHDLNENKFIADIYHEKMLEASKNQDVKKKIIESASFRNKKRVQQQISKLTLQDAKDKVDDGKKLNIFEARALLSEKNN